MDHVQERPREIDAAAYDMRTIEQCDCFVRASLGWIRQRPLGFDAHLDLFMALDFSSHSEVREELSSHA